MSVITDDSTDLNGDSFSAGNVGQHWSRFVCVLVGPAGLGIS